MGKPAAPAIWPTYQAPMIVATNASSQMVGLSAPGRPLHAVTHFPARRIPDCHLGNQTPENPLGRRLLGSPTFPGKFGTSVRKRTKCRVFQGFVAFSPILALESRTRGFLHKTADAGCHDTLATAEVVAADRHHLGSRLPRAPFDETADDVPKGSYFGTPKKRLS